MTNIMLVYIVKDHHLFPITDEKLKLVAANSRSDSKDLLNYV